MKRSFGDLLRTYSSAIITAVIIVAMVFATYVVLGITTEITIDFWANLIIIFVIQTVMVFLWIPEGKRKGLQNDGFIQIKNSANTAIADATKHYKELDEFCKFATDLNRQTYILNNARKYGVNYYTYSEEEYRKKLTEKQIKKVKQIEAQAIRCVQEIKSTEITSNSNINLAFDLQNHEGKAQTFTVTFKLIASIFTSLMGAMLTFGQQDFSWATTAKLFYYISVTLVTISFAMRTGIKLITETRKDYYIRMIDFLDRFNTWRVSKHL